MAIIVQYTDAGCLPLKTPNLKSAMPASISPVTRQNVNTMKNTVSICTESGTRNFISAVQLPRYAAISLATCDGVGIHNCSRAICTSAGDQCRDHAPYEAKDADATAMVSNPSTRSVRGRSLRHG